jgi:hypothetical protein
MTLQKNTIAPTNDPIAATAQSIVQMSNTVTRPGILTTEWWMGLIALGVSAALAVVGVSSSQAVEVAATVAPIVLALVYAFVRAHTKGGLADALQSIFPQATSNPVKGQASPTPATPTAPTAATPVTPTVTTPGPSGTSSTEIESTVSSATAIMAAAAALMAKAVTSTNGGSSPT